MQFHQLPNTQLLKQRDHKSMKAVIAWMLYKKWKNISPDKIHTEYSDYSLFSKEILHQSKYHTFFFLSTFQISSHTISPKTTQKTSHTLIGFQYIFSFLGFILYSVSQEGLWEEKIDRNSKLIRNQLKQWLQGTDLPTSFLLIFQFPANIHLYDASKQELQTAWVTVFAYSTDEAKTYLSWTHHSSAMLCHWSYLK